jgi:RNA polymerase sigma-54 factor
MKPGLQVRMSQHLALTPQLQQSIRLLQLSTLELHQELGQMLDQNPFLELEDDTPNAFEASLDAPAVVPVTTPVRDEPEFENPVQAADDGATADLQASDFGTTERDDWSNGTEGDDFDGIRETPSSASAASGGDDDFERDSNAEIKPSLQDHLHAQARTLRLSREDHCALGVLIESLDESGYLADALEDLVPALGALVVPESELALVLCSQHLELLAKRDTKRMMAATGADEEDLRYAHALILTCDPKPGRAFSHTQGQVVVPDVIVLRSGRGLKVSLNPDVMPKLRINDLYAQALRSQRGASGSPMGAQLQEARWFMKNVQQRFDTILRVAGAIVERQKNFFIHGEIAMKPLVLREIADELGLHESTISRVTTAKYLASPIGTFELKYFFGSSLNTDAGGNASSTAVRALIKQFVGVESPAKPLSDSQLSLMLEEQGIQVARRTVAKYREALKIAPANLRKAV